MAKRGRYSNETKDQANLFVGMLGGNVEDAHGFAFERSMMFWDEVTEGERDEEDAVKATAVSNYLCYLSGKLQKQG